MKRKIGAHYLREDSCKFTVWAPFVDQVQLLLKDKLEARNLQKDEKGYWECTLSVKPGSYYKFILDGAEFPDPASRSQPQGVHSWSEILEAQAFRWSDSSWKGIPFSEMIIYELHVGTFTAKGDFKGVEEKLEYLKDLGINCIEIMPVSQFPGNRNWGYDGVYPFATQNTYGGAEELKKLINSAHQKGIGVILDVVYNHMGPEGNYLEAFGPYFTDKYQTPWGKALNFDDKYSDEVREFFFQNALMWLEEFHFDGLRLDAVHEIIDRSARHFLQELRERVDVLEKETRRKYVLIAESDLNDRRMIESYEKGGYGLDSQWVDDFHHSLHSLLTGEKNGYYSDFGQLSHLAKSLKQAFVYDGIYSDFRKRRIGNRPLSIPPERFLICIQNHDQVGNRMRGERLSHLISFEALKFAAGVMLIAPFTPMLFMGEEFAEDQLFQYFVSHGDKELVKAVQEGRKNEFRYFFEDNEEASFPDPQAEETFERSKINWNFQGEKRKESMLSYYKELIRLRKSGAFMAFRSSDLTTKTDENKGLIRMEATGKEEKLFVVLNFSSESQETRFSGISENWQLLLNSAEKKWGDTKAREINIETEVSTDLAPFSVKIFKG